MRAGKTAFLALGISILFLLSLNVYAEVIVYDERISSLSESQAEEDSASSAEEEAEEEARVEAEVNMAELAPGGTAFILEGICIGDTRISSSLRLTQKGVIVDIKTEPQGLGFSLLRVEKTGEIQVLGGDSPDKAIGMKLSPGTYKVYPEGNLPGGASSIEQKRVIVNIGLDFSPGGAE